SFMHRVIAMRLINVSLMVAGIFCFRFLLLRFFKSRTLINLALFVFVMTPLVIQLSAQINYDNLLFPLFALGLLLTYRVVESLRKGKLEIWNLSLLLSLLLITA